MTIIQGIINGAVKEASKILRIKFSGRANEQIGGNGRMFFTLPGIEIFPKEGDNILALKDGQQIFVVGGARKKYSIIQKKGDIAISTDADNYIYLMADGGIKIKPAAGKKLSVEGANIDSLVKSAALDLIKNHTHEVAAATMIAGPSTALATLGTLPTHKTSSMESA